eukprot:Hpha_TRINITY_DN15392_c3_g7::TRINITY_DN15392_c3_g7_i1::g.90562::m.90562
MGEVLLRRLRGFFRTRGLIDKETPQMFHPLSADRLLRDASSRPPDEKDTQHEEAVRMAQRRCVVVNQLQRAAEKEKQEAKTSPQKRAPHSGSSHIGTLRRGLVCGASQSPTNKSSGSILLSADDSSLLLSGQPHLRRRSSNKPGLRQGAAPAPVAIRVPTAKRGK